MTCFSNFVGIDVGKFTLAIFIEPEAIYFELPNTSDGHHKLMVKLVDLIGNRKDMLVAVEPTGGYEWALWQTLDEAGFHIRQVSATHVHAFARSLGTLAKTDPLDARSIAQFIAFRPNAGRVLASENIRHLNALVTKRRQLVNIRKILLCQMKHHIEPEIQALNQDHKTLLDCQISKLDTTIRLVQKASIELAQKADLLRSIPGIGPVVCATLLAAMPELGSVNNKQIAALAGLAPINFDSGTKTGRRIIRGGRKPVRDMLYQAALVASTHNPMFKAFAIKLKQNGKPHKVVLIAIARKLLVIANAIVHKNSPWISQE